jgi:hypothetical protein
MPQVIEHHLRGKKPGPVGGEDHIFISGSFLAVFDGVTSRGRAVDEKLLLDGETPGRWAALRLAEALGTLDAEADAYTATHELTTALREGQRRLGCDPGEWGWPAAAQATIFSAHRREIWRIGDASIAVNGTALAANPTPLDLPAVSFRSAYLWALLAGGASVEQLRDNDPSWEKLLPLLEVQHHLRNHDDEANPFAYGLLDGRPVADRWVQVFSVADGDEVVLASDGYLSPAPTLEAAELELEECLREDPLLITRHLGFRPVDTHAVSFDDRAYLRFIV